MSAKFPRTKQQRDRDRADILHVLELADTELTTDEVIARAYGVDEHSPAVARAYTDAYADLRFLARRGDIIWSPYGEGDIVWTTTWRFATPEALDAVEDQREVARMQAAWTETTA